MNTEQPSGIITQGSTSFHYSFAFLPREKRHAMNAVYAFCRRIDDIVDEPDTRQDALQQKREKLLWWHAELERIYGSAPITGGANDRAISEMLRQAIVRFSIPKQYFHTLIDGCERDLRQTRYQTFEELKEYCYSVASIVGLICIEIFGYKHEQTRQYAINLGYALQLTNILRDVSEDKNRGYIYLPLEDLERFRYTEQDLNNEVYDERFIQLMEFQAMRAREFYHKARTLLPPDERLTMVASEIMDAIYYRLLEKIQLKDYQVYRKRIHVSTVHKLITALRIWVSSKLFVQRIRG